jgi:hypothetical protein
MTRSHVLLHCLEEAPAAARAKAWGDVRPSGIQALLASPRRESRLILFLKFSGVGRVVEDGRDEEEAWASMTDGWIAWEDRADARGPD